jgi:uncharacterized protein
MSEKKFFMDGVLAEKDDGPVLLGSVCGKCGTVHFPRVDLCPRCLSSELHERELSRKGKLHAWTITRVPLDRFDPPHPLGIVLLPDDKVSVLAPLVLREGERFEIGDDMELAVAPLWLDEDGAEVYGYKFAPAAESAR